MPAWLWAMTWGLVAGSALLVGAIIGYSFPLGQRVIASVMSVGAGVLISALSFELMEEAVALGGLLATSLGFSAGAAAYTAANYALSKRGGHHRKRSHDLQASEQAHAGSGTALAVGALLDGVPESIVIGVSLLSGKGVSAVAVAAVFLSNLPEGLSSAAGMRRAGRSKRYVFGVWGAIALASGLAALIGYLGFAGAPAELIAAITAVAAGAILAMLAVTMVPEASAGSHEWSGVFTALGFLAAFALRGLSE